ncbi:MAG: hypothetical protein BGO95_03010 [Micrococcales bacterium 73-13]|nr:MAG: hypothetical protein BGO95_03010 [Micrococcales bacterium 73-13]
MGDAGPEADALVARAAELLHANGQSTAMTLRAVDELDRGLDARIAVVPEWSGLFVVVDGGPARFAPAAPSAINMRRVAAVMTAVHGTRDRRLDAAGLAAALEAAAAMPVVGTALFAVACATGSAALGVIFGLLDPLALAAVALTALLGGLARRGLARLRIGLYAQVFVAALLAGVAGGLWGVLGMPESAALVAVCPAMVLVPGPPLLNGALDLLALRTSLGVARIVYGSVALLSITLGLGIGLAIAGGRLPVLSPAVDVPFWLDMLAAGIAAASFSILFSLPVRMILWPVVVGALAHGLHWTVVTGLGWSLAAGALLTSLVVGAALAPISTRLRIPFAGIGFAAIVAMIPGSYVFRALSGLVAAAEGRPELTGAISDAVTSFLVVIALAVGVAVPTTVRGWILARREARRA